MSLADRHCIPCKKGERPMRSEEAQRRLREVPNWTLADQGKALVRRFSFPDFASAEAFAREVGRIAEEEGHHPILCYSWGWCEVKWFTHAIDGLHENDFIMAAKTDRIWKSRFESEDACRKG